MNAIAPKRRSGGDKTRGNILIAATEEFAAQGLDGARIEVIARRSGIAKRMIYYYFRSKNDLYQAVFDHACRLLCAIQKGVDLRGLAPLAAMVRLVEFTFDRQEACGDYLRLVAGANIHHGEFIQTTDDTGARRDTVLKELTEVIARGRQDGVFRPDAEPLDVYLLLNSFCYYRVVNRHTWQAMFRRDLADPEVRQVHKAMLVDAVMGFLSKNEPNS